MPIQITNNNGIHIFVGVNIMHRNRKPNILNSFECEAFISYIHVNILKITFLPIQIFNNMKTKKNYVLGLYLI